MSVVIIVMTGMYEAHQRKKKETQSNHGAGLVVSYQKNNKNNEKKKIYIYNSIMQARHAVAQ